MTSTEIFNYVRKLELENGALKTAVAEYQAEEEKRKNLFDRLFSVSTSPEQPIENITPETVNHDANSKSIYIVCL